MRSYCGQCEGTSWCGPCYEVKRGRTSRGGVSRRHLTVSSEAAPAVDVIDLPAPPIPRRHHEEWRDLYPHLWGHLTQGRDAEGEVRLTSTLLFFLEGGKLKLCLHDRQLNRVAFLTVAGLPEALVQLEDQLERGTIEWRKKKAYR